MAEHAAPNTGPVRLAAVRSPGDSQPGGRGRHTPLTPTQGGGAQEQSGPAGLQEAGFTPTRGRFPREGVMACWDNSIGWQGGEPRRLRAGLLGGEYIW